MSDEYLEGIMRKTTDDNEPAPQCRELGGCVAPEMCQELGRCTSTTPHAADTAGPADAGSPDLVERLEAGIEKAAAHISEQARDVDRLVQLANSWKKRAESAESRLKEAEERAKATGEDGLVELSKRIRGAINSESNTGIHPRKVFAGMPEDWKLILDSLDARQAYWTVLECLFERFPDCPVIGDLPGWVDELKAENESAEAQVSELQQKLLDEMDIGNDLARRADAAEALAKANQEDAEKYRLLRMNTGKEYNVSTYGVPHALRITFDANGCEKYLPDGTLNFPKTLDAILDDERKIRSTWTHSAARGAKP